MAIDQSRRAVAHRAELNVLAGILRLMVEHAVIREHFRREHLLQFRARVWPMGAELVEQSNILAADVRQVLEQPRDEPIVRRCARDVREGNADFIAWPDDLS